MTAQGGRHAQRWTKTKWPPALAVPALVRQSRQSGHDGALSGALPQFRLDQGRAGVGQADRRHRADRFRPVALQSSPSGAGQARARGHPRRRRHCLRVPDASDPGNRQAADRGARPQPRLSQPGRSVVRLSARRRGADHRLRQDHAGGDHGGRHGEHSGDRALGRADAQRLVERRARGLRHGGVAGAPGSRRRQDRLPGIPRHRGVIGAIGRPLQHHGNRVDHERVGGGARHVAARLRRDPGALPRARTDRLRDRPPRGRDRARGPQALGHPYPPGVRERHRRLLGDRRLDQCADPYQRDRPPRRRCAVDRGLGDGRLRRSAARQHAAGGQVSRRGVSPCRRIAGGDARIAASRPHPRRRAHHQRQDHGRERQGGEGAGSGRDPPVRDAVEEHSGLQGVVGKPVRILRS